MEEPTEKVAEEPPKKEPKKKKSSKDKAERDAKKKKKKKKKEASAPAEFSSRLSARARARLLCRVMELRISITRYYSQEAQYLDRVRTRVAMHVGAFHESGEWRYGRKVLSALDSFAVPREVPDELRHDLDLLRRLEAALDDAPGARANPLKEDDVPDDDLPELAICLREEIENLRASVDAARRGIAQLEGRGEPHHDLPPPPPPGSTRRGDPLPPTPQ